MELARGLVNEIKYSRQVAQQQWRLLWSKHSNTWSYSEYGCDNDTKTAVFLEERDSDPLGFNQSG